MLVRIKFFLPLILSIATWLFVYWQSLNDMTNVWLSSETYKHCFFILPIVLYLIYEKRNELQYVEIRTNNWLLIPLLIGQVVFLLADLIDIKIFVQLAAYGSLICLLWIIYGSQIIKALIFPLFYLVLAIPMGEELVPHLQNITADISVFFVELTGIPVYREGLYIYVSNGTFVVAEACAGIRFLIATIAMGFLYAYLFYRSFWRRTVFVLICIVVPIIANGIRAYGIIAIGHYSDMEHAVGADHLVYGWFFFAFILLLIMTIGNFWREDLTNQSTSIDTKPVISTQQHSYFVVFFILIVLASKPLYQQSVITISEISKVKSLLIPQVTDNFLGVSQVSWQPNFNASSESFFGVLDDASAEVFIGYYAIDKPSSELISWSNQIYSTEQWSEVNGNALALNIKEQMMDAKLLTLINSAGKQKKVLYWYQVNEKYSADKMTIKLAQLRDKLSGGTGSGHIVAISLSGEKEEAKDYEHFLTKYNLISER